MQHTSVNHPLLPSLRVQIDNPAYKLLDFTVNPVLFVRRSSWRHILTDPPREGEVWMEFVIGHDSLDDHAIPVITLLFNGACKFSRDLHPPEDDEVPHTKGRGSRALYEDIWYSRARHADLLLTSFGPRSQRVVPTFDQTDRTKSLEDFLGSAGRDLERCDCKAGLAFRRSNYDGSRMYERLCYPVTWQADVAIGSAGTTASLSSIQTFLPSTLQPNPETTKLNKNEAFCFWYFFPYTRETAQQTNIPEFALYTFLLSLTFDCEIASPPPTRRRGRPREPRIAINYFPRIPLRYKLLDSRPLLHSVARLDGEPSCWERPGMQPMRPRTARLPGFGPSGIRLTPKKRHFNLYIESEDIGRSHKLAFYSLLFGVPSAIAVNIIAPKAIDDFNTTFVGVSQITVYAFASCVLAWFCFIASYYIFPGYIQTLMSEWREKWRLRR